jgi:hypothetical protein
LITLFYCLILIVIDYLFYLCVDILVWLAKVTGTTYEFVNIVIFVIGYPLFVIILLWIIYLQYKTIKKLNAKT